MLQPYSKTISLSLCVFSMTGLAGCQYAQQKVYQQASRPAPEYHEQMETTIPRYQSPGKYRLEPAPAPLEDSFPPAAPPSLIPPGPEQTSNRKTSDIRRVSDEATDDDSAYFKSMFEDETGFDDEPEEPAQKYLGLVPHYSTVSSSMSNKVKQMNGKVKGFYSRMKSHVKTPDWVRKVSGSHAEVIEEEAFEGEFSCINSIPEFEEAEMPEEMLHPEPANPAPTTLPAPPQKFQPQPELKSQQLPQLPPPGEATNFNNSWRVSAIREPLTVEDFSTSGDQLEMWPYSKQVQQQQVRKFEFKTATPVSTPDFNSGQPAFNHPRELSVPSMISQEESVPLRKISYEQSQSEIRTQTENVAEETPVLITPRQVY
ncbi:hypothetical protein [Gimesia sp.]|uniref:hypothetical protein n=1 Tax=Gimesia sp. TaxID=2024833 RepID=UPI003A92098E